MREVLQQRASLLQELGRGSGRAKMQARSRLQEVGSKAWDKRYGEERRISREHGGPQLGDIGRATLDSRRQRRKESRMQGAADYGVHLTLLFYLRIQIVNAERGRPREGSGTGRGAQVEPAA